MEPLMNHYGSFYHERKVDPSDDRMVQHHAHQGIELYFIHSGQARVMLDRSMFRIRPNTLMLFQPFQVHTIELDGQENRAVPFDRNILVFDPHFLDGHLTPFSGLHAFFRLLWRGAVANPLLSFGEDYRIANLFEALHRTMEAADSRDKPEEVLLFLIELLHVLKAEHRTELESSPDFLPDGRPDTHTEKILEWIERHYREEFELERLADYLYLSPSYTSALFKERTGLTLMEFIIARRLREACLLLKTTSLSVKQITQEIGLASESYFCHLFKKQFGLSPGQYRKASLDRLYGPAPSPSSTP